MNVSRRSMLDGKIYSMEIDVDPTKLVMYLNGMDQRLIQDIFPDLTVGEREFIKSGITPEQWDKTFKEDES